MGIARNGAYVKANAHLTDVERVAGSRPERCPWYSFKDPLVADVIEGVKSCLSGDGFSPSLLLPLDPPHVVWKGVVHFVDAMRRTQAHDARVSAENNRKAAEHKALNNSLRRK